MQGDFSDDAYCLMRENYQCVLNETLAASPRLRSHGGREPDILGDTNLISSIPLILAYQKLRDDDAAARLLQTSFDYIGARLLGRGQLQYRVAELYLLAGDQQTALQLIEERE